MAKKNDLGAYVSPKKWNDTTIMCYKRGCYCYGCEFSRLFGKDNKCQVKAAVLESVRVLGVPFEREVFEVVMGE